MCQMLIKTFQRVIPGADLSRSGYSIMMKSPKPGRAMFDKLCQQVDLTFIQLMGRPKKILGNDFFSLHINVKIGLR